MKEGSAAEVTYLSKVTQNGGLGVQRVFIHGVWQMGVRQPKEEKKSKGDMLVVHG